MHEHVSHVFFAASDTDVLRPAANEANVEMRWFTHEDLDDPSYGVSEVIRFYAHAALDALPP